MIELEFNASPIIREYDYDIIGCFERLFAELSYSLHRDTQYHLLLEKYSATNGLTRFFDMKCSDWKYYDEVGHRAGIDIQLSCLKRQKLTNFIVDNLYKGIYSIAVINDIRRPNSKHYKVKDHPYFMIIYGYDSDTDEFLVYDIPLVGEYWLKENRRNGIEYIKKRLSTKMLAEYSAGFDDFSLLGLEERLCEFSGHDSYCFTVSNYPNYDKRTGKEILLNELMNMVETEKYHKEFLLYKFDIFNADFNKRYDSMPNITLEAALKIDEYDTDGLKKYLLFPFEWKFAFWHYAYVKMLNKTLPYLRCENKSLIDLQANYEKLKNSLIISILRKDFDSVKKCEDRFIQLYEQEIRIYKSVIEYV